MAKLKVYRTPIGFHDAYVAAPSQKAALKAWGADADLFARGVAEMVTDESLLAEPLARPGEVVFALLDREPLFLLPQLRARGHAWVGNHAADASGYRLLVRRGADA